MNKQQADELIVQYLPKIYGFAIKKAFSYEEAEELSSDIVSEVYLSLLSAKEILNMDGYIWRISEHVYSKFVSHRKNREGISIDGMDITARAVRLLSDILFSPLMENGVFCEEYVESEKQMLIDEIRTNTNTTVADKASAVFSGNQRAYLLLISSAKRAGAHHILFICHFLF